MGVNVGRANAARKHLNLIRSGSGCGVGRARMYVDLAFKYGLTVDEISTESGISPVTVRWLLLGDA